MRTTWLKGVAVAGVVLVSAAAARGQWDPVGSAPPGGGPQRRPAAKVTIQVVDSDGKPVAGAAVGQILQWAPKLDPKAHQPEAGSDGPRVLTRDGEAPVTDAAGRVTMTGEQLFAFQIPGQMAQVVAMDGEGKRVGIAEVQPGAEQGQIRLEPACRVSGTFTSPELDQLGRKISASSAVAGRGAQQLAMSYSKDNRFHLLLPPGTYQIQGRGSDTYSNMRTIEVPHGRAEMQVEMELPASRLAHLFGKPAPELRRIKDWKNGGPVKLADLKGKVVVLDFWGFWCGPCVFSMPEMTRLHEKFADKGLVIIGVHNDSAESFAEVDQRLAQAKAQVWGGKDLPFLLALDGGGEVPIEGGRQSVSGATCAAYGIMAYPTTVLIDKDGILVDQVELRSEEGRKVLAKYLGVDDLGERAEPTTQSIHR
jgi:thiol-disulfide isomerase/thioredoxin